ncbi:programmed cell death protein 2 [Pseudomassariella vexata]|uniref:Programmed cell death protein 2 n=1 Tax=Pseudomassariella vexata TaxID=1141098 RepID=A0A1Y2DHW5_9PEZI|nr:programmed cell death protein 2 [Pseudomassariella vexata]ORY58817.1 programmed cell death protein 2 [Pseudomassariella vexata]
MAPYDSESSGGEEEEEYTETNVLLGYASKDAEEDTISRLGGRPEWLDPDAPPSGALARCKICKELMVLLLQLNGELPDRFPGHERRLYVFSCRRKNCRRRDGNIRVLRGVRVAPGSKTVTEKKVEKEEEKDKVAKEELEPPTNLGETLFGAKTLGSSKSANPFSTSASTSSNPFASSSNPFSSPPPIEAKSKPAETHSKESTQESIKDLPKTFAETLSLNNFQPTSGPLPPPEPWPAEKEFPAAYPISYLTDADYETLEPTPPPVSQATARMDIDDPATASGGKEDREVFESSMDFDFQKFADRLAQNPEQVIRYEYGGQPLLYSKTDAVGKLFGLGGRVIPRCGNCGAGRTFEVQLTPNAIAELEAEDMSLDGMDWGTVIVGVCESDCQARAVDEGKAGYLEEWVGVQWEDLTSTR